MDARRFHGRFPGAAIFAAILLWTAPAAAFLDRIDPGDPVSLDEDEGLLVVAVDTSVALDNVRVRRDGSLFGHANLRDPPAGQTFALYRVEAGNYRWQEVRQKLLGLKYDLRGDPSYEFSVRAGAINYAGDLIFRPERAIFATIHVSNRGLRALDWLEANHRSLHERLPFHYTGHYADPFPTFLRALREEVGRPPVEAAVEPPEDPRLATHVPSVAQLWRPQRLRAARLAPGGTQLALVTFDADRWAIELIDLDGGRSTALLRTDMPIAEVVWSGDRALVFELGHGAWNREVHVVLVEDGEDAPAYRHITLPVAGGVVDVLPDQPGWILFGTRDADGGLAVHRVELAADDTRSPSRYRDKRRIDPVVPGALAWFADAAGELRLAMARRGEEIVLVHRDGDTMAQGYALYAALDFVPLGPSADGRAVVGLSDEGRAQKDLVEFDGTSGKITRTLHSRPGADLVGVEFGPGHQPIGARYLREGQVATEYFDAGQAKLATRIARAFPDRSVSVIDRDRAGRTILLMVTAADDPGTLYALDLSRYEAQPLARAMPWLDGVALAQASVVKATGADGIALEGFLTLPREVRGRAPLVVMPHGGPVGIADTRHFAPDVQFLAGLGYAVLQVNFRGSYGYGRAFREAGKRRMGTLIEDDIDAVLRVALATQPLDAARICAVGESYGGYSALISAIRWPERFRCAVSIAGVSDRLLRFTASDASRTAEGRAAIEEVLGDPETDGEAMREQSPLYRARDLRAPVMMVHGREDLRVDFEHTRRLQRVLALLGRPPLTIALDREGHGIVDADARQRAWHAIATFLARHLDAPDQASAATASAADAPAIAR